MKKVLVVFAVLALTMAMASVAKAEVAVNGSIEFLMRSVDNIADWSDVDGSASDKYVRTYERVRLGVDAKFDNVKGRLQIENDWDTWGRFETPQGNATVSTTTTCATDSGGVSWGSCTANSTTTDDAGRLQVREAWVDFNMPFGIPGHIKVGHQFLKLGNGWFFRSGKYGSDAWVVGFPGKNTVAFVNVKVSEGQVNEADDTDAYVLLDTYKIDDKSAVGAYIVHALDRRGVAFGGIETTFDVLGLHYNGVIGPVKLEAEFDIQSGDTQNTTTTKTDYSGTQLVLQASMPLDALNFRATFGMGSGDDATTLDEDESFGTFLDKDPHYTLVYEYFMNTAAGAKNTGFSNTTAIGLGADFKVNDMITLAADVWMLEADQKVALNGGTADTDLGTEVDVKVNLKLYDQLSWNTTIGVFMPGKAYENAAGEADNAQAIQSVLSFKF